MSTKGRIEQYIEKEYKLFRNSRARTILKGVLAFGAFAACVAGIFAVATISWWAAPAALAAGFYGVSLAQDCYQSQQQQQTHLAHVMVAKEAWKKAGGQDKEAELSAVEEEFTVARPDEKKWAEIMVNRKENQEKDQKDKAASR